MRIHERTLPMIAVAHRRSWPPCRIWGVCLRFALGWAIRTPVRDPRADSRRSPLPAFSAGRGRWSVPAAPNGGQSAVDSWLGSRQRETSWLSARFGNRMPAPFVGNAGQWPASARRRPRWHVWPIACCDEGIDQASRVLAGSPRARPPASDPATELGWYPVDRAGARRPQPARNQRRAEVRRGWRGRLLSVSDPGFCLQRGAHVRPV